jgi:hypothetical protein
MGNGRRGGRLKCAEEATYSSCEASAGSIEDAGSSGLLVGGSSRGAAGTSTGLVCGEGTRAGSDGGGGGGGCCCAFSGVLVVGSNCGGVLSRGRWPFSLLWPLDCSLPMVLCEVDLKWSCVARKLLAMTVLVAIATVCACPRDGGRVDVDVGCDSAFVKEAEGGAACDFTVDRAGIDSLLRAAW